MFDILVSDLLRYAHLLAVAVGLGVAIETETFMLMRRKNPISEELMAGIEHRHRVVFYALGAMWVTGMALIALRTGFQISAFTPKLWAKISVVTILTVNAYFVAEVAIPILADYKGRRISAMPKAARKALFAVAGISATSWLVALGLGSSALLRVGPAWFFQSMLPVAYIAGIFAANYVGQKLYAPETGATRKEVRPQSHAQTSAAFQASPAPAAMTTAPVKSAPVKSSPVSAGLSRSAKTLSRKSAEVIALAKTHISSAVTEARREISKLDLPAGLKLATASGKSDPLPAPDLKVPVATIAERRRAMELLANNTGVPKTSAKTKRIKAPTEDSGRASDLAIAFPQKSQRGPRLRVDPSQTPAQKAARKRLEHAVSDISGRR
ncbi:MAG: hypothetical protein AAGO57_05605 [Pseudomonadota bacterium]